MRIDRDKLQKLLAMSDEELWRTVCAIGNDHGLDLPKAPPPKEEMARLRGAIDGNAGINVGEAIRVVKSYKRSEKNGRNS